MSGDTGERIRTLRTSRGFSQAGLAAAIGVSKSYLSHIEAGRRPVTPAILRQVAEALDVEVTQLEQGVPVDAGEELHVKLRFAEMSLRNGDWDLAASEFAAALEKAESLPLRRFVHEAAWGKARADEATGRLEQAIEGYERLLSETELSPAVPRASVLVALIRAYSECGDLSRAIDVGETALSGRDDPGGPASDVSPHVELLSTLAGCYLERGDLTRAQLLIGRALDLAQTDGSLRARAAAAWNAALIAEARHDAVAARLHADTALALYSEIDNARAVGLLRVVSAGLRLRVPEPDPGRALPELGRAIEDLLSVGTRLDIAYAHTEQARAMLLSGDAERAAEVGQQALSDLAEGDRLQRGRTLVVVGRAAALQGNDQRAVAAYREAASVLRDAGASRQAGAAWRELAEAYVDLGHHVEAIEALRQASDLAGAVYNPMWPVLDAAAGQPLTH
jgi:transcriptional regulator with XRE-family HTH domain